MFEVFKSNFHLLRDIWGFFDNYNIEDDKKLTIELGLIDWLGLLVLASDSYKECWQYHVFAAF